MGNRKATGSDWFRGILLLGTDLDKVPYIRNAATHVFNLTEEKGKIKGMYEEQNNDS